MSLIDKLNNRSQVQKALDARLVPQSEPFIGETLLTDGWEYGDLPRMSVDYFVEFENIVGEENIRWLTIAEYHGEKFEMRGQYFISPKGKSNLADYMTRATETGSKG